MAAQKWLDGVLMQVQFVQVTGGSLGMAPNAAAAVTDFDAAWSVMRVVTLKLTQTDDEMCCHADAASSSKRWQSGQSHKNVTMKHVLMQMLLHYEKDGSQGIHPVSCPPGPPQGPQGGLHPNPIQWQLPKPSETGQELKQHSTACLMMRETPSEHP